MLDLRKMGVHYRLNVISHRVSLNLKVWHAQTGGCATNWRCVYLWESTVHTDSVFNFSHCCEYFRISNSPVKLIKVMSKLIDWVLLNILFNSISWMCSLCWNMILAFVLCCEDRPSSQHLDKTQNSKFKNLYFHSTGWCVTESDIRHPWMQVGNSTLYASKKKTVKWLEMDRINDGWFLNGMQGIIRQVFIPG